ncbi:gamma-glutamylcyclotransferase [Rhinolophus ferrumequinum]|nr:gamma-glutamylcyclotransferase [Rhinolophus ferrumequinum]
MQEPECGVNRPVLTDSPKPGGGGRTVASCRHLRFQGRGGGGLDLSEGGHSHGGPTANQKSACTRLAQPTLPTFLLTPEAAAPRPLSWSHRPACCVRRSLFIPALRTQAGAVQASREWDKANSGCEIMQSQEEETFLYFAYGSNLMSERIHLHNPSATFCYVARLQDFELDFGNSQGKTSETWHGGIATVNQSPGNEVWGVVWKINKSNLSSLDKQEGVNNGTYVPIEINVYTQEGKEITCRSYQMKNYEQAPPSPQYKKVICIGAKESGLPLEYQKKLNAIEPNDYKGKVSEEIEDIIKKGDTKTH